MGTLKDVAFAYDDIDEMWRLSLGDHADISAAYYNGDYCKSLEQAQRDKHEWILKGVDFKPGDRVLDIGCGWGPILKAVKERGGEELGLTLSPRQYESCRRNGLNVLLRDWKELKKGELGKFNAVVSVGAFEHFCSIEEYMAGQRESVYGGFFRTFHDLLMNGGKLYLQTMTWGKNLPWGEADPLPEDIKRCSLSKPYKSDERTLALFEAFFPGAWLPRNFEQVKKLAAPYFRLILSSDGRLDYVQTITEWEKAWYAPKKGKRWLQAKTFLRYCFKGRACRAKMQAIKENAIREVFIRDLCGHQRIFFEKI
jgi:cyclopropane-fatty-acyl-phospholipid synthase